VSITSWREFERDTLAAARLLRDRGVTRGSRVAIALAREPAHAAFSVGAWRLGACVLPLNPALPAYERNRLLSLAGATSVVGRGEWLAIAGAVNPAELGNSRALDASDVADVIACPGKCIATGGSTGSPKLIEEPRPWGMPAAFEAGNAPNGMRNGQRQLVSGPLHHNSPFNNLYFGLFRDHSFVLMERFDPVQAVELIGKFAISFLALVPAQMRRMLEPARCHPEYFKGIEALIHTGAPCPAWLKLAWIELVGGAHLYEMFGSTEGMGTTSIRGDEWLAHPGSVGRPWSSSIRILDAEQRAMPQGQVGEIYGRAGDGVAWRGYIGAESRRVTADGYLSVGDLGWMDADGYLYIADRRQDLIISGGINIYPAEVEEVLQQHPGVEDAVVVGRDDEDWGKRVHAVVQLKPDHAVSVAELRDYCRAKLEAEKVPKSIEFRAIPRDEAGKVRRASL
jgi:bile acid-coenzyme A ligase